MTRGWLWTWSSVSTGVDTAGGACSVLSGFVDSCQLPRGQDRTSGSAAMSAVARGAEPRPRGDTADDVG